MSQAINEMEIEVPTIIYAYTLNNSFGETIDCNDFYSNQVKMTADVSALLCSGGDLAISTFNFANRMTTAFAWTDIILNNGTYNPAFYADLMFVTGMNG